MLECAWVSGEWAEALWNLIYSCPCFLASCIASFHRHSAEMQFKLIGSWFVEKKFHMGKGKAFVSLFNPLMVCVVFFYSDKVKPKN